MNIFSNNGYNIYKEIKKRGVKYENFLSRRNRRVPRKRPRYRSIRSRLVYLIFYKRNYFSKNKHIMSKNLRFKERGIPPLSFFATKILSSICSLQYILFVVLLSIILTHRFKSSSFYFIIINC